ncbi:hypothetical protein SAMN05421664_2225 [Chryseobacterium soldanellicola]|uniref:Uncharacterized protein n=1 Tax=Chryseobacterium soldanellicola TaxID=311333 RepID=A0A1H1D0B7_9FLAO|nr:hypothetical protein SAMN05421664_2225 [Chryseobacterium soldanellicola]
MVNCQFFYDVCKFTIHPLQFTFLAPIGTVTPQLGVGEFEGSGVGACWREE